MKSEDCFGGPPSKSCLERISACRSPLYLGVGPSMPRGGLSRSIQLLHLYQAGVEYFIPNLADYNAYELFVG